MKEKKQKRVEYLRKETKLEIISKFFEGMQAGDQFGYKELGEFLEKNYEWFNKIPKTAQQSRLWDLAEIMKEFFGENIEQVERPGFGVPVLWTLLTKNFETPTVKETEKKERKPRRCSVERLKKFYLIIKKASESKVGISKKDVEKIMGYETTMTIQGVNLLNDQLESETGFRPLTIDKKHIFVNYDILQVDKEMAEMVLEELNERLEGNLPEMPMFEGDFESVVKSIIRKDYSILSMFVKSNTIFHKDGDMDRFKEAIIAKTVTLSYDEITKIFNDNLEKRYDIIGLKFITKPRKYITIADTEDNSRIKQALIKIESTFAEYFCEDIVDHERTIWEQEYQKESTPNEQEQSLLNMIEFAVFEGKDGELFLSDLWRRLDLLNVVRGWKILDILKKSPEKFKVEARTNSKGITEDLITYMAPEKEEIKVPEKVEEEEKEENETQKPVVEKFVRDISEEIVEVYVGFSNREDIRLLCGEDLNYREVCKYHEDYVCKVTVDKKDKKSILNYLKLYYASIKTQEITIVREDCRKLIEELEELILR